MFTIGLSSCEKVKLSNGKVLSEDVFVSYAKSGIEYMELSSGYQFYKELNYKAFAELAEKHRVKIWSLHLPFEADIDISNPVCAERTLDIHREIIRKAADVGIKIFVLHPSAEPIDDADRPTRMALSKKNLARLAEYAANCGGVIAVENLPRTCLGRNSQEMLELISADERLTVCFDTNHLLTEDSVKFIKTLKNKIITTHVSDYDFVNERHWMPGEGKIDWQGILAALKEVGYEGPWLYEINFEAPRTIVRERDLTCEDFAKNARELFENKDITVIGTPKPNLGMWG